MPLDSKYPPTQEHLTVQDIKDNLVILKDGTISIILQTSSVNFDLLSETEQDAKILAFAQLLNSVTHPFQILIRTKKVDITNYLSYISSFLNKQGSQGLKRQISIYLRFVQNLIIKNEVLDKSFYIMIPYRTISISAANPLKQIKKQQNVVVNTEKSIEPAKAYLYPKRDHIMKQLIRMGLHSHQLSTKEIIEMFYEIYNPDFNNDEKE